MLIGQKNKFMRVLIVMVVLLTVFIIGNNVRQPFWAISNYPHLWHVGMPQTQSINTKEHTDNKDEYTAQIQRDALLSLSVRKSLRLWVDLPNSYPWRYCLKEYNQVVTFVTCSKVIITCLIRSNFDIT